MLIFNLLLTGLASTSFIFIPVYKEYQGVPHAILYKNTPAEESEVAYTLVSVAWTLCDEELSEGEVQSAISGPRFNTRLDDPLNHPTNYPLNHPTKRLFSTG